MITVQITLEDFSAQEVLTIETLKPGSWINVINPTDEELDIIARLTNVPVNFITAAMDADESSRVDFEEYGEKTGTRACLLVVINIARHSESFNFDTLPLGIILTSDYIITVCAEENGVLSGIAGEADNYCTWKRTKFLLQILYKAAALYLRCINEMNKMSDRLEANLRRSMTNDELFKMMDLEKCMTYFTAALRGNRVMIDKLSRIFKNNQLPDIVKLREEDEDLLEDVKIENDQAYDMIILYSNVISSMMDAFASIISNNLNTVMRFLTSVTIIIAVPTAIASYWGMNVSVPFMEHHFGFAIVFGISVSIASAVAWYLWKRKMM